MKASNLIIKTLRDAPSDAAVDSHKLMLRAGLVRSSGSGLYHLLPMGLRIFRKIENIIRQEMDSSGALEFSLPILTPSELWKKSNRWDQMGRELFRVKDRHDNWSALGPTHEESFTQLMKGMLTSYKDLPVNVYQIHTKFRDEIRPRFGVIRSREFVMKDAYSFDLNDEGLENTYQKMRTTYRRIFKQMGLETISVEADSGSMGGSGSEEFMVASSIGEETLLLSEGGKYKGNQEKTPVIYEKKKHGLIPTEDPSSLQKISTPNCKSIEDVANFLKINTNEIMKAVALKTDDGVVIVFLQGDRDLNEVKLAGQLKTSNFWAASPDDILKMGSMAGFIGPFGISEETKILFDASIQIGKQYTVGANENDHHLQGFVFSGQTKLVDLALAKEGDLSPDGDGKLTEMKGIEVGHIFKLGKKYTECFGVSVLDPNGKSVTPTMGCYGIGLNRSMATIIEQKNDEMGIVWPISVAPYEVVIVGITKGEEQESVVEKLYDDLRSAGMDVLLDDRPLRPGVKFKDAELIGYPIRITAGKGFFENEELEFQVRSGGKDAKKELVPKDKIVEKTLQTIQNLYKELK